ncbi:sugar ABC transporter ATP-binding protein [Rhodococcoides yunnanense]|uniref:sugar ABC transporter ATP-binding protein n=1 Tax=Rhodococcoides yunnanense TaxID=278209 RepID=UPI000A039BC6|nr:sugar ABC transporter ATP-binding protein [Rhodococcus yunnanensis]
MSANPAPGIALDNWSVRFGATTALDQVSTEFPGGTVTALLGENGSGKSTLIKVLSGLYTPSRGATLTVTGAAHALPTTGERIASAGIRFLHQDLGLVGSMTVAENIALGNRYGTAVLGRIRPSTVVRRAREAMSIIGVDLDPDASIDSLHPSQRTLCALARAYGQPLADGEAVHALILDEPSATLDPVDTHVLHRVVRRAAASGTAVVVVTHRLDEVVSLADRIVVLRHGRLVEDAPLGNRSVSDLAAVVLGAAAAARRPNPTPLSHSEVRLRLTGVVTDSLAGLDLDVRAGEVVGVAGLLGDGTEDLSAVLAGRTIRSGSILVEDKPAKSLVHAGVVTVPADRRRAGVVPALSVAENIALASHRKLGLLRRIDPRVDDREARTWIAALDIRPADPSAPVASLSGGNQQKVSLAKALASSPRVLVLNEPTQGVDVGARRDISDAIDAATGDGLAVVLITSDHEELLELSDRILVLHRGVVGASFARGELTGASLLEALSDPTLSKEGTR